jgi:hypothetical protein
MKRYVKRIERTSDADERLITFADGVQLRVNRGWTRLGGWGWQAEAITMNTRKTIRETAIIGRILMERRVFGARR